MSESSILRVLLVEDNPSDTLWVTKALGGKSGTKVELIHAECLSAGLEKLEGVTVDAILLDLTLPDSQGLDTFYRIKARTPDIPILILSSVVDEALVVEAVQHGAQDYLVKGSIDMGSLHQAIRYSIERTRAQQHLTFLAHFDQLTGLPNRSLFFERFGHAIKLAQRMEHLVALLFVDLDHFKDINDSIGHHAGDVLLRQVADRLRICVRECDTVSRMGGDEFSLVLEDIASIQQVSIVAK